MAEEKDFQQRMKRIEDLVGRIESLADPVARANANELVQSLMDLHGAGIERMMEITSDSGEQGMTIIDRFAEDKLTASLLLLYGLHPLDLETRLMHALDKLRPYLKSNGADVALLGIEDGVVRLNLEGGSHGCGSSTQTLKLAIEEAIYEAAPDITELRVEGVTQDQPRSELVQLGSSLSKQREMLPSWEEAGELKSLETR